ncbi:hypothetical protein BV321_02607 [Pseudomonas syringae pv. actinidiae]|nr:hypothetical protein BV343_02462 [Pseudomonas syringae pv. actinidiae]OSN43409.1 hypothetical protein BV344_02464 [Pseudomonas syringae pv. actinidiae]OSR39674.1 hypothetical protein BV321_02607 [Pseudomonas syringae pv. actinidiae]OSR40304.1 hypothetical protein BV322_02567 [Pseudomonas syringae pv. actinidiae]OSS03577.1 hypothetical protein BV332_02391 [Pseudomonas syringae pv. actinidiae]
MYSALRGRTSWRNARYLVINSLLGCVTNAGVSQRCCIKDGSRPPGVCLQELASNRPVLLRSKGVVVSDRWKRRR